MCCVSLTLIISCLSALCRRVRRYGCSMCQSCRLRRCGRRLPRLYHLHGGFDKLVATNDGQCHTFYNVGRVLNATIDTLLSALTNAMHVVILKPVDVRRKQRFLDILKLRLPDDSFNSFHTLINVTNERPILTHCNVFDAKVWQYVRLNKNKQSERYVLMCFT